MSATETGTLDVFEHLTGAAAAELGEFLFLAYEFALCVVHVHGGSALESGDGLVDGVHAVVFEIVNQLHGVAGFLGAVVRCGRDQVPVVKLPIERRPCGVKHPLHYAGSIRNVATECLVHTACSVVVYRVCLAHEVFYAGGRSVF